MVKASDESAVLPFPVPESPVHRMARPLSLPLPYPTLPTLPLSKRKYKKKDRSLSRNSRDSVEISSYGNRGASAHISLPSSPN